jgi:hypothetical protein
MQWRKIHTKSGICPQKMYHFLVSLLPVQHVASKDLYLLHPFPPPPYALIKKENEIFLIYKEIQMGSVAKS